MKVIGITGGAGSGKSEVLKILKNEFNAHVIIADDVARHLSEKGQICYNNIIAEFGTDVLGEDGEIDRPKLASIVFNDEVKLQKLNKLTHPFVRLAIESDIKDQKQKKTASCIVVEAALLIESGYTTMCDEVWFVYTDAAIRRQRMKETRGYTDAKVDSVMANQLDEATFREKSDRIITNNSTLDEVRDQLSRIFQQ